MTTTDLSNLAQNIYIANEAKGFWDRPRPLTETTMLIVTELAEAVEEERAGNAGLYYLDRDNGDEYGEHEVSVEPDTGLVYLEAEEEGNPPLKPEGVDVELIDALIRLLDLLGSRGTDVDGLLRQKLAYNESRPVKHGKAY